MKPFSQLSANESIFGLIYYLLQLFVIPAILIVINLMAASTFSEAALNTIMYAINFAAVLIIFRKFLLKDLRFFFRMPWHVIRWAGIGFLIYMAGNILVGIFVTAIDPNFANINDASIMEMVQENYGLMTLSTVLLVPIVEECFYRVLLFRNIYDRSPWIAYLASMVIFSFVHVAPYIGTDSFGTLALCFVQYLPAGFALAFAYRRSGSIFASVLIHMTVNQIGMLTMR